MKEYNVSMKMHVRIVATQKQSVRNSLDHGIHSTNEKHTNHDRNILVTYSVKEYVNRIVWLMVNMIVPYS